MSSASETTPATSSQPQPQSDTSASTLSEKLEKMSMSSTPTFNIWPPTQRTRDAVINRLMETLSTPSVLSKRYGTLPQDEASATAHAIEEEAFSTASASVDASTSSSSIDEGIEILQIYSKEISKRMLDAVKSRANADNNSSPAPETSGTVGNAEVSSVDDESSA